MSPNADNTTDSKDAASIGINEDAKDYAESEHIVTWKEKMTPANPIGFTISSLVCVVAILVFFFAIPCPE